MKILSQYYPGGANMMMKILWEWNELPEFMKTKEVRPYYNTLKKHKIELLIKRIFDIVASSILIILLMPLFFLLSVWIKLDSQGPVFYRQKRVTQYGRIFKIYKFRTMKQDSDKVGSLITVDDDERITNVGKKLRPNRLDELPQLFNVWKGEMSFVGVRPEIPTYVKEYTKEMYATLLLPAGVTSLASIKYKNESKILKGAKNINQKYIHIILPKKMYWNLKELKNFSLLSEGKLLLYTIKAVL